MNLILSNAQGFHDVVDAISGNPGTASLFAGAPSLGRAFAGPEGGAHGNR
jgi:hypothetical protein